jgi:hypothetical protein
MNMIEGFKQGANAISNPTVIFTGSIVLFSIMMAMPRIFTSVAAGLIMLVLTILFFAVGMTDTHFRNIVTLPDNVPIVGMLFIFGYFTWFAMRKAVINDDLVAAGKPTVEKAESEEKVMVFPYLIYIEFVAALFYSIMLVLWSIFLKAPLEDPANPSVSPNPSKAPWYFLGLQEMLVYYDPWIAGVLLPTLIILGLCAIPYIDNDPKTSGFYCYKPRKHAIYMYLFGFWILWILLIVIGTFLRGPNWNFFGPFEPWDVHKLVPLLNVNLSEFVWIKWLGVGLPKFWLIREAPGIILVSLYFALPTMFLAKTQAFSKYIKEQGAVRFNIYMILGLTMMSLPIKMYLRWAFNLKYIVGIPEFFFNI